MCEKEWVHAYKEALSLNKDYLDKEHLLSSRLSALATEQLKNGKIILDQDGLSEVVKMPLITPLLALWEEWKRRHSIFIQAFQECQKYIDRLHNLEKEIKYEQVLRIENLSKLEEEFKNSDDYLQTEENRKQAIAHYKNLNKKYARIPKNFTLKKTYWILVGCFCLSDFIVNMQVFGPLENGIILAILLPIILAVILSFSLHIVGKIAKQYFFLLVNTQTQRQKIENYTLLSGGIIAVIFVLVIVGLFCDQAIIKGTLSPSFWHNSLWAVLTNFLVWCMGVGAVYLSYDADPFYLNAEQQQLFWENQFHILKEDYAKRRKKLVEDSAKEERLKIKKYEHLKQEYSEEFSLWEGIEAHGKWLKEALHLLLKDELEEYRVILINRIQLLKPLPQITIGGKEMLLEDYKEFSFDTSKILVLSEEVKMGK